MWQYFNTPQTATQEFSVAEVFQHNISWKVTKVGQSNSILRTFMREIAIAAVSSNMYQPEIAQ